MVCFLFMCKPDIPIGLVERMQRFCDISILLCYANNIVDITFVECELSDRRL